MQDALQDLSPFDLFRYARARQNGLSEDNALAVVRGEITKLFDVAWNEAPDARAMTIAAVGRWFEKNPASGRFFVDDDGICAEVRTGRAATFIGQLTLELERARIWDSGETSRMAFSDPS